MAADHMFYQPSKVLMVNAAENKIDSGRLVIGVKINNEAKAYPIRLLGYHHQVQDTLGGEPIMVTYCTVCRTGRVFEPMVNGKYESGKSKKSLTGTDSLSWKDKSWVIGVKAGANKKAHDWNKLKTERIIQDKIENTPVLIVLAGDNKSFFAFERPNENATFSLSDDVLHYENHHFRIDGKGMDMTFSLKTLQSSQEFW